MNKKGISPLIVTVLLIGFAIALAAIVMTWGTGFVRETTEEVGASAEATRLCMKLNYEVEPDWDAGTIRVTNNADLTIDELIFRVDGTTTRKDAEADKIGPFGMSTYDGVGLSSMSTKLEVIAKVGTVTCAEASVKKTNPSI